MHPTTEVCPRRAAMRTFKLKRRPLIFLTLFALCLLAGNGRSLNASAAADGCTTPSFAAPVVYNSTFVRSIAIADFDVDGNLDMAALNSGSSSGGFTLLLGDGTGAFPIRGAVSDKGRTPSSIAAADFDNDGRPDVAISNGTSVSGNVSVYLNSNLSFQQHIQVRWTSPGFDTNTTFVAAGDFNSDGNTDLAALISDFNGVFVALGNGTGNFSNLKSYASGGFTPLHLVVGDFNGDTKPDLAVANLTNGGNNVGILLGDGTGSFGETKTYAAGASPAFIAKGDFNSDNKLDLAVVANSGEQNVAILLNTGAGAFAAPTFVASGGTTPASITAADFNNDQKIDLAMVNQQNTVSFLTGDGAGNFNLAASRETGATAPRFVTASDLNKDGLVDLVVGHDVSRRVSVFLNNCGAGESTATIGFSATSYAFSENAGSVPITVNRSGALDTTATVNYATVDATANSPADYAPAAGTLTFAPGEASKTFNVEIVNDSLDEQNETFAVLLSNPTGAVLGTTNAAQISIFDNDATPTISVNDVSVNEGNSGTTNAVFTIALSAVSGQSVSVNYATMDASATDFVDYTSTAGTVGFAPGETVKTVTVSVKGDTVKEVTESFFLKLSLPVNAIIVRAQGIGTILEDDGLCPTPTFNAAATVSMQSPIDVLTADFNRDGKADVAAVDFSSGSVRVRLGDGAGGFGAAANFPVGQEPRSLAVADFNLDGKIDIVVARSAVSGSRGISVLLGDGAGGFAAPTNIGIGASVQPYVVAVGDFNSDGKPDVVYLNIDTASISVKLGDGAGGFTDPPGAAFSVGTNRSPRDLVVGDFNGDNKLDVAIANLNGQSVSVVLGSGNGLFGGAQELPVGQNPSGISAGDFNNDSYLDLVVTNFGSDTISLLLAKPGGSFNDARHFAVGVRPNDIVSADLNGDGWLDVVTANGQLDNLAAGDVSVLFGNGMGQFALPVNFPTGNGTLKVIVGEFNSDAKKDLVVANFYSENLSILLNACAAIPPGPGSLRFNAAFYQQAETGGRVSLTVIRTDNTAATASVDYRTVDTDTFTVGCFDRTNNVGGAYARCDFATVVGRLDFAAGEVEKTITVPIIDDGHVEGVETFQVVLSNASGATLGAGATTNVDILDNDVAGAQNPVTSSHQFFVRQQYLDFLSREPDTDGFNAWLGVLNNCANPNTGPEVPSQCDRIYVSGEGFFRSLEFQLKGGYVFRFYKVAFGRLPEYTEIVSDMSFVAGQTAEEVYARKAQLAQRFTERAEFQAAYGALTNAEYVNALLGRYQLTQVTTPDPANPDGTTKVTLVSAELRNRLDTGQLTRAAVLRAVADSDEVGAREFNNAFVGMQYYGYLRRKPDPDGFAGWLRVLQSGDVRTMVNGFLNSTEYKLRFGQL